MPTAEDNTDTATATTATTATTTTNTNRDQDCCSNLVVCGPGPGANVDLIFGSDLIYAPRVIRPLF